MTSKFGEKIKRRRKEKKLTLEKLAELTDSSKSYIWELENKNPPRPSAAKLAKIAEKLDLTIDYLLDDSGEHSREDAIDAKFYREYKDMDDETKEKVRQIVRLWGKPD